MKIFGRYYQQSVRPYVVLVTLISITAFVEFRVTADVQFCFGDTLFELADKLGSGWPTGEPFCGSRAAKILIGHYLGN